MKKSHGTIHEVRMDYLQTLVDGQLLLAKLERMEREKAQKDSATPPQHKWKHADVFENYYGTPMICIEDLNNGQIPLIRVFCLTGIGCDCTHKTEDFLKDAKFLFNIKEKL